MRTSKRVEGGKEPASRGADIYAPRSSGAFYSPFSLGIDDMEQLILVDFKKDPDEFYNTFELQQARDANGQRKLLAIAYRKDGTADVYHQAGYPFCSQATILNDVRFHVRPMEDARFAVHPDRLDVYFAFADGIGRPIEVKVSESDRSRKNPFFLLAPIGTVSRQPAVFPIYSLHGMSFAKRKFSRIEIRIGKRKHAPDSFPLPIDGARNYLTRYSPDTFNVDWNKNFQGALRPLRRTGDNNAEDDGTTYELSDHGGHPEIKRMSAKSKKHQVDIRFSPPFPEMACIRDGARISGEFSIATDGSTGVILGEYALQKIEDKATIRLRPVGGWRPKERRLGLKLLFFMVKMFSEWPKSYAWNAEVIFDKTGQAAMKSRWERI